MRPALKLQLRREKAEEKLKNYEKRLEEVGRESGQRQITIEGQKRRIEDMKHMNEFIRMLLFLFVMVILVVFLASL